MAAFDKRTLQKLRVPLGFIFTILFLIFARPALVWIGIGVGISLIGLLLRAWASGHIRKSRELAVTGPYAYTRNPLYLGSFFLAFGCVVASGVWWLWVVFIVFFFGIYLPVMSVEAEDMRRIFGEAFDEYESNVPAFLPRLTAWRRSGEKFDLGLYLQYREYRAALGIALAFGVLAAKAFFIG